MFMCFFGTCFLGCLFLPNIKNLWGQRSLGGGGGSRRGGFWQNSLFLCLFLPGLKEVSSIPDCFWPSVSRFAQS